MKIKRRRKYTARQIRKIEDDFLRMPMGVANDPNSFKGVREQHATEQNRKR